MSEIVIPSQDTLRQEALAEPYKLGAIESVVEIAPSDLKISPELSPGTVFKIEVKDPYIELIDPELVNAVKTHEDMVDDYARRRRESGKWERVAGTAYIDKDGQQKDKNREWGDPVSHEEFFSEMDSQALRNWLSLIPSANALTYLSDPLTIEHVAGRKGEIAPADDIARLWLTTCTDAVAIRNRGTVMAELVKGYVDDARTKGEHSFSESLKWMSVACGTALPAMKAALHSGLRPELLLVDSDENALMSTQLLAKKIGFDGVLEQHEKTNIFNEGDMAELRTYLGDNGGRPRVIDLMGIFEYTGEHTGIDPAKFLRSNYDMLHPGGRLILGQMRDDRPNPDFTMGVVGWPFIVMRSPEEVMQVIKDAGIQVEHAKMYVPEDGVYTVVAIDKPDGAESFAVAA